jgi:polysaccharide pyruvyl transferase WcaK-like protein
MPYWALRLAILRLIARPAIGFSIGAGPLSLGISRYFGKLALRALDTVSVRDARAKSVLESLTKKRITVVPDPALMLRPAARDSALRALRSAGVPIDARPLVGVALRRWFHTNSNIIPHKYAEKYRLRHVTGTVPMQKMITLIAAALDLLVIRHSAHIVFMPTYNVAHENDALVCAAVAAKLRVAAHSTLILDDPRLYTSVAGELAVMLAGRMHAAILAAARGTPVVGLAYNPKFQGFFELMGQADHCESLPAFVELSEVDALVERLSDAIGRPQSFVADTLPLAERTYRYVEQLFTLEHSTASDKLCNAAYQ